MSIFIEKTSGITKATTTANINNAELCLASYTLKLCLLYFSPPTKKERPPTNNKFPRTDPVNEANTTSISPARKAKIEIISSTAFPKVAFNSPPILGPDTIAKLSVALPIKAAKATIVKQ